MGSVGNPQSWVPYQNIKDCSQGFCSLYCPQWCYIIFPPPPPYGFPEEDSSTSFSPLVIAIIGILVSAFLLISYYTVISKYCGNLDSRRRRAGNDSNEELNENQNDPSNHELYQVSNAGLDEALIKLITVCKYSKKDGLIEGTDCSVCLSEFQEDEHLRLLPKCSHAFHVSCIDTWLKSHSNCPLCRANIVVVTCIPPQLQLPPPPPSTVQNLQPTDNRSAAECEHENTTAVVLEESQTMSTDTEEDVSSSSNALLKGPPCRLGDVEATQARDTIIEIRDEGVDQVVRRSISMDYSSHDHVSIGDILCIDQDEDSDQVQDGIGSSSKQNVGGENRTYNRSNKVLHCVTSPIAMKRSSSSGRFLFGTRHGRGKNVSVPM